MEIILYLCLVSFLAGLIQGFSGFGSVLLSLPLLALFMDVKIAVPLMALSAMALTVYLIVSLWRHLAWEKIVPLLIGSLFGIPAGVFVLKELKASLLLILLGIILVAYSLYGLVARPYRKGLKKSWAYLFGFLAGCLGGAFTASGPPVIVYTSLQPWSKDEIKVTLQGYFFVSGILVIFFQALGGLMTDTVLKYFLISLPPILIGTWAGHFFSGKVREETYRRFMLILLGFLGAFTIWKAI
jgi:uncharacterized protein